jgi:hypothetical protein
LAVSVVAAVEGDLARLPEDLAGSGLAAVALAMAERIDAGRGSPSECGKVLVDALLKLRDLAPPKQERTKLDELSAKRATRLAGRAAAKD